MVSSQDVPAMECVSMSQQVVDAAAQPHADDHMSSFENGMPERFNQTLLNMLGPPDDAQKTDFWRANVPAVVLAFTEI
ncbi:hypothetical protein DPMN_175633 [Dreissena polymorpha]|uniref:Uncharacterized protein n=1 Tax=Dreissena polymorpha TaxID=45954 RepID=A0A9D4E9R7_DREPO|nr:hypothetical protein DPMN_175633 [Dreissena polymorpha]